MKFTGWKAITGIIAGTLMTILFQMDVISAELYNPLITALIGFTGISIKLAINRIEKKK